MCTTRSVAGGEVVLRQDVVGLDLAGIQGGAGLGFGLEGNERHRLVRRLGFGGRDRVREQAGMVHDNRSGWY